MSKRQILRRFEPLLAGLIFAGIAYLGDFSLESGIAKGILGIGLGLILMFFGEKRGRTFRAVQFKRIFKEEFLKEQSLAINKRTLKESEGNFESLDPETQSLPPEIPNEKAADNWRILLEDLRNNDNRAWDAAALDLYNIGIKTVKLVWRDATKDMAGDIVSEILSIKIVPQILNPTVPSFQDATCYSDIQKIMRELVKEQTVHSIRKQIVREAALTQVNHESTKEFNDQETDTLEWFRYGISKLDEIPRKILTMYYMENRSTRDISNVMNLSNGSVCSHLNRGRFKLKEILESEDFSISGPASRKKRDLDVNSDRDIRY